VSSQGHRCEEDAVEGLNNKANEIHLDGRSLIVCSNQSQEGGSRAVLKARGAGSPSPAAMLIAAPVLLGQVGAVIGYHQA